jgi:hypothetical protein
LASGRCVIPYIKEFHRPAYHDAISQIVELTKGTQDRDGFLNYVISTIITACYDKKYTDLNAAIGMLECAKLEFYRRVVASYEDQKCFDNGDVFD